MKDIHIYEIINKFNRSDFRKNSIPMGLVSGWPSIRKIGKTIAITLPYFSRVREKDKIALYPLYCSVTFPVKNIDRILDFTIFPNQESWKNIDYSKPIGYFKHKALSDVNTKEEYEALCQQLYSYYDDMIDDIINGRPFSNENKMRKLFSKLMEPDHLPQYLKINKKFYGCFCRNID